MKEDFDKMNQKATRKLFELLKGKDNVELCVEQGCVLGIRLTIGKHSYLFTSEVVE